MKTSLVLGILLMAGASWALFGCGSENCNYNVSSSLWSCNFVNCPVFPVNYTNFTIVNMTNITVVNATVVYNISVVNQTVNITQVTLGCDNYSMIGQFNQRVDNLTSTINCLIPFEDCKREKSRISSEFGECVDNLAVNYVPRNDSEAAINFLRYNMTSCEFSRSKANSEQAYYFIGGFAACYAVIWYFMLRKPTYSQNKVTPVSGETTYDIRKLESKNAMLDMKQKITELEEKLTKKDKKGNK